MGPIWDAELRVWDAKIFGPVSPVTHRDKEALAIRRIISKFDMSAKAKFSNSPNDFKIRLFG